ncbi:hypothetical protein GALMADRAFT_257062 [Galerina marginata CBS 339.88]|uniref:Uncharacterized protein n=1 Tax=Galerina marginata (strain CBS 339.88) TaxID=685588 RepID=A0A067SEI8_GALM3|nr:hypothetical protein GALMADRAFT_257062 [Galerina marginata CBS 339.88]
MANLIRSAKSGNDWTARELAAYNITIVSQTKNEFFGTNELPAPGPLTRSLVAFMTNDDRANAPDDESWRLLHYLDLALDPKAGQEAAADNFTAKLLEKLAYNGGRRIVFMRRALPFLTCGVTSSAQTDICVMDDNKILLLVQNKSLLSFKDPEPQVIAEAIAAYAMNNKVRQDSLGLPPLASITFPAITMVGTNPYFYKITVTAELSAAVQQGMYPTAKTKVLKYVPVLPRRHSLGMRPLENRVELMMCLESFKQFLGN